MEKRQADLTANVTIREPPKRLVNFYANLRQIDRSDFTNHSERLPDEALQSSLYRYIREQPEYKSLLAGKRPVLSRSTATSTRPLRAHSTNYASRPTNFTRSAPIAPAPINVSVVTNKAFHKLKAPPVNNKHVRINNSAVESGGPPLKADVAAGEPSQERMDPQPRAQCSYTYQRMGMGRIFLQMDDVVSGKDSRILSMTYASSVLNANPKVLTDDIVRLSLKREVARDFIVGRIENRLAVIRTKRRAHEEMLRQAAKKYAQTEAHRKPSDGGDIYQSMVDLRKVNSKMLTTSGRQTIRPENVTRKPMAMPILLKVRRS